MKKLVGTTALMFLLTLPVAQAEDKHHPDSADSGSQTTAPQGIGAKDMDKLQDRMTEMQKTMDRVHQAKNAAERNRLLQEHMDQMHETMVDMRGMMGAGMKMQGSMGMMGSGQMGTMDRKTMDQGQQMMERRLDMMQGMMEQMMEQMMVQQGMSKTDGKNMKPENKRER